jgi:hypothetical protein
VLVSADHRLIVLYAARPPGPARVIRDTGVAVAGSKARSVWQDVQHRRDLRLLLTEVASARRADVPGIVRRGARRAQRRGGDLALYVRYGRGGVRRRRVGGDITWEQVC